MSQHLLLSIQPWTRALSWRWSGQGEIKTGVRVEIFGLESESGKQLNGQAGLWALGAEVGGRGGSGCGRWGDGLCGIECVKTASELVHGATW